METVGRWTVAILLGMTVIMAQSLVRYFLTEHWALLAYETALFIVFGATVLDRVLWPRKKTRSDSAQEGEKS